MIRRLRRLLSQTRRRRRSKLEHASRQRGGDGGEATPRIEAARQRLKATIRPPQE